MNGPLPSLLDRTLFDHAEDATVGAEEELFLVDAESLDLLPVSGALVDALADGGRFRRELSAAQIEIVTGVGNSSSELSLQLADGRRRVIEQCGGRVRLMGVGAHPFSTPWTDLSPGSRYETLLADHGLGARLGALAAGLHVHVAVRGADRALAVYNGLRELMPLLIALGANAPFIAGRDSGLATVRCKLSDALPRHGTGPSFPDWHAFETLVAWGRRSGAVPDPSQYWWDCRLNCSTGTVEVRAPDAQSSVEDAEALIAVIHAAAADILERHDGGEPQHLHAAIAIDENRWRAAGDGITGQLLDLDKAVMVPTRDLLATLLDRIGPVARRQGNSQGIDHARALLEFDMPGTLRAIARSEGLHGVCDWLATRTEQTALRLGSPTDPLGTDTT